jgi:glycosyltransferase involved in cell wall biosynthesis
MDPAAGERLIVIGPTPPPTHGVAVVTMRVLASLRASRLLAAHLDTTDARSLENLGRLDMTNVRLGIRHAVALARLLASNPRVAVYLPLAPSRWGFLRDALFIALAKLWRRRVYVHLHGGAGLVDLHASSGPLLRFVMRATASFVYQAWALTPSLARDCRKLFPAHKVRVVGNVVEDRVRIAAKREITRLGDNGEPVGLRVLYLSNLIPEKGCFDLVEAVHLVGERARGWRIRMVGEAPNPSVPAAILRRARELPDGVRVEVPGAATREATQREYRWADIFVLPSRYRFEAQPLVILEALAAGLPIVSTWHAGIPDTVRDGKEGILVPPGDPQALGEALVALAADPDLRAELGRRARQRYENAYTPERLDIDLQRLLRERVAS